MTKKHVLTQEEMFCLEGCGSYAQYYEMRKRFEGEVCPFCTIDEKVNLVIYEDAYWRVMDNAFPNDRPLDTMLLIASTDHSRKLCEISESGWLALHGIMRLIETHFFLPGGMLFMRFGDMRYNAGTVPHLHFNLWVPNKAGEVRIPVFKSEESQRKNMVRSFEFSKRYQGGETPEQPS